MLLLLLKSIGMTQIFYFENVPELSPFFSFRRGYFYLSFDNKCIQVNTDGQPISRQIESRNQLVRTLMRGELGSYMNDGKNAVITHTLEIEIVNKIKSE